MADRRVDRLGCQSKHEGIGKHVTTRHSDRPRPPGKRPSGQRRAASIAAPKGPSILLVDDHPPNLMALEAILEPTGARLLRASSGAQAVEIAAKEDLALVLLDLQMPELDG